MIGPLALAGITAATSLFQNLFNRHYQKEQNAYNSPASQMQRYKDAGLNPNLVYTQGTPGNQTSPFMVSVPDVSQTYNQSRMADYQTSALEAKTEQTRAQTEVTKLQAEVLRRNPMLNDVGFISTIESMRSAASIKASEAKKAGIEANWYEQQGDAKLNQELALLMQRFDLGTADQKLKASVLTSKNFQNAMLEIQKKFMVDAEVGPQQILMFVKMLLMKLL